jgi:hypothetical protein
MRKSVLTVLLAACATNASTIVEPARTVVLDAGAARLALKPCTRVAPAAIDSLGIPKPSAIRSLVQRVSPVLRLQPADDHGFHPLPVDQYVLGVAAFHRDGRQWLYGSFATVDAAKDATPSVWPNWCDGSWQFFGVEYDVAADTIGPLHANEGGYAQ